MADPYNESEVWDKIRAIDLEIEKLTMSTASGGPSLRTPLKYSLGEKKIDIEGRVRILQEQKRLLFQVWKRASDALSFHTTPSDYEIDDLGEQYGDEIDGTETA